MWLTNSTSPRAGRRSCVSRLTNGCVGLKGAPGNGPKPVMRKRSLSLILTKLSHRHAREGGHPVNADAYLSPDAGSGILDRPLSRTMTTANGEACPRHFSPQHVRDLLRRQRRRDAAVGHLG